jgi:hypothetical protein
MKDYALRIWKVRVESDTTLDGTGELKKRVAKTHFGYIAS